MLVMTDSAGVGGRMSERGVRANVTAVHAICFAKITNGIDGNYDFGLETVSPHNLTKHRAPNDPQWSPVQDITGDFHLKMAVG